MRGSNLLPKQLRSLSGHDSWLSRSIASTLLSISSLACQHPIHTLVVISLLASTSYVGLLQESLFDTTSQTRNGRVDVTSLLEGGRTLELSSRTSWKWHVEDNHSFDDQEKQSQHLALATFIFPHSSTSHLAPLAKTVPVPSNVTARAVPSTANLLSPISHDSSLAFSVPWSEISDFLTAAQEIRGSEEQSEDREEKIWIMKAARSNGYGSRRTYRVWLRDGWTSFVDLIKHAETLDIVIMTLGYLSMHLTFISLFLSMKRLGSNFWLATSVLLSSVFAFLFGLLVTTKLGVPINMVLLSEGLPFLVVTIGFEKPIILTKAVLSASYDSKRTNFANGDANGHVRDGVQSSRPSPGSSIQDAILSAVRENGFEIVRDYAIEIAILVAGAASGVQGGLRQFCFLAAWILLFDCALLFTFYTTILCVKLEINRIRRHIELRKALEEDGINRRVAENVASSNDWPRNASESGSGFNIFGQKIRASSVPKFKIWMVTGFVIINVFNLCTIPFRNTRGMKTPSTAMANVLTPTPIDPFKVAENGLDAIYVAAKGRKLETYVTVLAPIKYELEYPSVHYSEVEDEASIFDLEYTDQFLNVVGGRVIEGVLKSLEDPVLSKWVLIALTMSLILNGYLFNAARWSLNEPHSNVTPEPLRQPPTSPITDPKERAPYDTQKDTKVRSKEECEQLLREKRAAHLNDEELIRLSLRGKIPGHAIEKTLEDPTLMSRLASFTRAVKIRRAVVSRTPTTLEKSHGLESSKTPYKHFNYELVHGACCENVIGYLPIPLGVAGPLMIDGQNYFLPMATTEGVLVASTSRGCKAINAGGGAVTVVTGDGMTRGPCVGFPTLSRAGAAKVWLDSEEGKRVMTNAFNSTSRFARLQSMKTALAGTYLYIRFKTTTGDAMGMNMISKGVEKALHVMATESGFSDMSTISVSGNFCTDKKPAAVNWIDGRGKSVVAEAIIPGDVVRSVLKSDVNALVELNISKNLIGSAMAGSIGGFNAHASNIVTAMFLATGQDPAQNVESSNCITIMKNLDGDLQISVSMPSIEVGTIGGGTILEAQSAMLEMLGVRGAHPTTPGENSRKLARIIGAAVLAGELSLCSALAAGHLVQAHMAHNRSAVPTRSTTPVSAAVEPFMKATQGPSAVPPGLRMTNGTSDYQTLLWYMQKYQRSPSEGLPSPTLPPPPHETQSNQKFNSKNPYKQETPLADMSAVPRAETISPSITRGSDWAGMNGFGNTGRSGSPYSPSLPFNRGDLVTPPQPSSTNGGQFSNATAGYHPEPPLTGLGLDSRRKPSGSQSLGPSPTVSIANSRSSDGTLSDQQSNKYRRMEAELLSHYTVLKAYLRGGAQQLPRSNKARDKLLKLSPVQFHELSTDVFDELQRRQASAPSPLGQPPPRPVPQCLLPRNDFHEKRNHARQKLSSLQDPRFRDLSTDVFCELERRFPHFQRMDRGGRASPGPGSQSRDPPYNSMPPAQNGIGAMQRGPPPPGGRGGYASNGQAYQPRNGSVSSSGVPRFDNPPFPSDSDYGRPMPKQFQSNTIMPNKSVMVEDEDEYGGAEDQDRRSDAFGLDRIAASLPSNRDTSTTSRSAGSLGRDAKLLEAAQAHEAALQRRVNDLEISVKSKNEEIRRLEESTKSSMSSEWVDVKQDLERRLEDAERLNQSMKEELERLHMDQANVERDLRSQLDNAKRSQSGDSTWKRKHDKLERDYQDLQAKLKEQRKVTEEVKQQASGFLAEMRAMADGGGGNLEREERLQSNVQRLEEEVKEWKARYARTKTQLRNMRASSLGLSIQRTDATRFTKDDGFTRPDGLVKDVHITKFQIAIDELLHIARAGEPSAVLDYMKGVVVAVRNITQDIVASSTNSKDDETSQRRAKLKSNVSATANNVITASKNFATSNGMSPVSLLDAAASHLTAAIVELVRTVKIRPTPAGELEDDDDGSLDPIKSPGLFSIDHSTRRISGNDSVYSAISSPPSNAGRQHGTDRRQSPSHPGGSFSSGMLGNGLKQAPSQRPRSEIEELKLYLEDQTDALVHSIQSLVASIRAEESMPSIRSHISEIASIVGSVVSATESSIQDSTPISAALKLKAESSIKALAQCKAKLMTVSAESESLDASSSRGEIKALTQKLPPLAFEIARETKELSQKIDLVGAAEREDFS